MPKRVNSPNDLDVCRSMIKDAFGFEDIDLGHDILLEDEGDYALFEKSSRVYAGHYFFKSRGREAYSKAEIFLHSIFNDYDAQVVKGLTPLCHAGALWLTKRLGFVDYGVVQTVAGEMRLSILTRKEYNERNLRRQ